MAKAPRVNTDGPNPPQPHARVMPSAMAMALRQPTWDDLSAMFEMQCDPVAGEMAGVKPRTREVFMARWKDVLADPAINSRVIELAPSSDGPREVVGSISVFQVPGEQAGRNNIGYWIARAHWGKGIATRALAMFLAEEPRRPLHATAAMSNLASHRVLLKNGFRLVGTHTGEETDRYLAREVGEFVLE